MSGLLVTVNEQVLIIEHSPPLEIILLYKVSEDNRLYAVIRRSSIVSARFLLITMRWLVFANSGQFALVIILLVPRNVILLL